MNLSWIFFKVLPTICMYSSIFQDPSTRAWMTTLVKEQKRREMSTMSHGGGTTTTTTDLASPDWDSHDDMYLVCVHNVSPDQPYTILRAPHSSTAQDIITQVRYLLT